MNNSISELARIVADELAKQLIITPYGQVGVTITTHGGAAKRVEYTRRVSVLLGSIDEASASDHRYNTLLSGREGRGKAE